MTAGPVFQESDKYGQYEGAMASFSSGDLMSSDAGAQTRAAMSERYWQRGAFEQVSGFNDAMYSMTGGSTAIPCW